MDKKYDKLESYQNLHKKLNKALQNQFYLEAIFIEYAIIEDRLKSILELVKLGTSSKKLIENLDKLIKLRDVNPHIQKYFAIELISDINDWRIKRNKIVHESLKQGIDDDALQKISEKGYTIVKILSNKSQLYRRMVLK
jgi:hypothetical protein